MKRFIIPVIIFFAITSNVITQTKPVDIDGDGFYNISILEHLRWISENDSSWTWNFELDNDINAANTKYWNVGNHDNDTLTPDLAMGWCPIGNDSISFAGNFKGHNYSIDSLYINRPVQNFIGLFGNTTNNKTIDSFGLKDCDISGLNYVGGIIGFNTNNRIEYSFISGNLSGHNFVGGLVGENIKGNILNSSATGNVVGRDYVGGLAGHIENGNINESFTNNKVSGVNCIGGLVGSSKNCNIVNSYSLGNVSGNNYIGGLAGENIQVSILNSWVTGNVEGKDYVGGLAGHIKNGNVCESNANNKVSGIDRIGGLFGKCEYCKINYSNYAGDIIGNNYVGGLVGENVRGNIFNSWATGNVEGTDYVGGLTGNNFTSNIRNSYSTSNITGTNFIGGLVGDNNLDWWDENCYINNSYALGIVNGVNHVGGLVGHVDREGYVKNSFWDKQTSGIDSSAGGTGKTTDELKSKSTFTDAGWNFDFIWIISSEYPIVEIDTSYRPKDSDNDGYINISKLSDLRWLSESGYDLNKNFELDNDIDASDTRNWNGGLGFFPIGDIYDKFPGSFDGNKYTVHNLYINCPKLIHVGFFSSTDSSSVIENIGILNCDITGLTTVGGLVGGNDGTILNSYTKGDVKITGYSFIGGLVGGNSGIIINSSATGNVSGGYLVGGLVGYNSRKIVNSYASSYVSGEHNDVGGLVGLNQSGFIDSSYATGSVMGTGDDVGGLIGECSDGYVSNSFATGSVIGTGGYFVGGLVGRSVGTSNIDNSYATSNVSGIISVGGLIGASSYNIIISKTFATGNVKGDNQVGGLIGHSSSSVSNSYATGNVEGDEDVGGLVGRNSKCNLKNSFSSGIVGGYKNIGGLVGFNYEGSTDNSFWDIQTSGIYSSAGGTGKTTAEMKEKFTFTNADWDFEEIWNIDGVTNSGYPYLRGLVILSVFEINTNKDFWSFLLFPNPANLKIQIEYDKPLQQVVIYNILGMQVWNGEFKDTNAEINIENFVSGVYCVRVGNNVKMFVKE
ncbi:MAG: GLUG motif-containing protein [bacterium]